MRAILLGLGNPILGDDGVGLAIVARARDRLPAGTRIEIAEEHQGGLRVMERLIGYDRAVIVDAVVTGRHAPGTIFRLHPGDVPTQHTASGHDVNLSTALLLAGELGLQTPRDVQIVAIEAESVLEFSSVLTPAVAAAVPAAVDAVIEALVSDAPPQ